MIGYAIAGAVVTASGLLVAALCRGAAVGDQPPDVDPELAAATQSRLFPALNTEETQQP